MTGTTKEGTAETLELRIDDVVYPGRGLARHEGRVVFVPGVLKGERVRASLVRRHKTYSTAHPVRILETSPKREQPACPLAFQPGPHPGTHCPGCCYQHVAYEQEVRLKQAQLADLLEHLGHTDAAVCRPALASPLSLGYRNRLLLHAAARQGRSVLGYVADDNRTVLDVETCPLAMPALNDVLTSLRSDPAFMSTLRPGEKITLRYSCREKALWWKGRRNPKGGRLVETTCVGDLLVPRSSFFQVNPPVTDLLLQHVMELLAQLAPRHAIDLYGGVGLFAFAARRAGVPNAVGIDVDREAISAARRSARARGLDDMRFLARTAMEGLNRAGASVQPADAAVIVDPPRRGLEKELVQRLGNMRFAGLIYVSCAPDTLARDIARLETYGYKTVSCQLADMFPRTSYFESVTLLTL